MTTTTTQAKAKHIGELPSKLKSANLAEFRLWDSRGPTDYVYVRKVRR